jgi:hypothetical protein
MFGIVLIISIILSKVVYINRLFMLSFSCVSGIPRWNREIILPPAGSGCAEGVRAENGVTLNVEYA